MIKIIQNEDKSYDLFDSKNQVKITNEYFEYINGTRHFFIVTKFSKHGVYNRKGVRLVNCDYLEYFITKFSKSIVLKKTRGINVNSKQILLSKENKCTDLVNRFEEIPNKLNDGSYTFILSSWDSKIDYYRLWNTRKGYIFSTCNNISILTDQTLKCKIGKYEFIVDYFGQRKRNKNFLEIFGYINGASLARTSKKFGLIDINGDWIDGYENLDYDEYSEIWDSYSNCIDYEIGLLPFKKNGFYGLMNYKDNLLFEPISSCPIIFFTTYNSTETKYAQVTKNGLSGIIDNQLNWVVDPIFEDFKDAFTYHYYQRYEVANYGNPYIVKSPDTNKYGLLSFDGKWLCEPIYDEIKQRFVRDFVNSDEQQYLIFKIDNYEGIIDRNGKELLRGEFEICWLSYHPTEEQPELTNNWRETTQFHDEYLNCCVQKNNLKGLVSKRGKWILEPKYEKIQGFFKPSIRHYLNEEDLDQEELNEIAQRERFMGKNKCVVRLNGQNMIVDKKGKVIEYLD
jgi:hypothetical protein